MAISPTVRVDVTGARGEGFAATARRIGTLAGLPVPGGSTDAEVLDIMSDGFASIVAAAGYTVIEPVRVATTANIALSGEEEIDGVPVEAGDRVLVKDQIDASENGIYVAAAGAWGRASDFDDAGEVVKGSYVRVEEGGQRGAFVLVTEGVITVGTTDQLWRVFRYDTATKVAYTPGAPFIQRSMASRIGETLSAFDSSDVRSAFESGADAEAALNDIFDYGSQIASATGRKHRIDVPGAYFDGGEYVSAPYIIGHELNLRSNTSVDMRGAQFRGEFGNALGHMLVIRCQNNIDVYGGDFDSNFQTNDNAIAISHVNPDQTVAGPPCENIRFFGPTSRNCRHGGSHIPDPYDPADIGRGGGKGITVQFGAKNILFDGYNVFDCDIGLSVEGKESGEGYTSDIKFTNGQVVGSRYMGAKLASIPNTVSLYGRVTSVDLNGTIFRDCASGKTLEAVPQDVALLYGVITSNAMVDLYGRVRIENPSGLTTLVRGAMRNSELEIKAIVNNLQDGYNAAAYDGYQPRELATKYSSMRVNLAVLGATGVVGYLVNGDPTYPVEGVYAFILEDMNGGSPAGLATARYTNNLSPNATFILRDQVNGRYVFVNDGASPTLTASNVLTWINGVGFEDDSGANLSKLVPGRANLAMANNGGASCITVGANGTTFPGFLYNDRRVSFGGLVTWRDGEGRIRIKNSAPSSEYDGAVLLKSSLTSPTTRPANPTDGEMTVDGPTGKPLWYVAGAWRDATGAAV